MTEPFSPTAIVDFADDLGSPIRRLTFTQPEHVWRASTTDGVIPVLDEVDRSARAGRWVVGFVSYEAGSAFDSAFERAPGGSLPLAWFASFRMPAQSSDIEVQIGSERSAARPEPEAVIAAKTAVSNEQFATAIRHIHEYIDAGDVYQVNLTVPFTAPFSGPAVALYERMQRAQGGAYSCLLQTEDVEILSASPELFFERRGDRVRSRPMKGTAARGLHPAADEAVRRRLLESEKERAENVMIVDVVRNDLGRLARVGSVHVTALCEAERYPTVWQLTSTVEAEVSRDIPLSELFRALFPPASVTGAPKIRAAAIIGELEAAARGVYCGAVGVVRPGGDATFNVAIRTAWATRDFGLLHLNAGGGVTTDSTVHGELNEVAAKLTAFTQPRHRPALFETIRVEKGDFIRLERHLARLAASAEYFDIPFDRSAAMKSLQDALTRTARADIARARLDLDPNGAFAASIRHDPSLQTPPSPARVRLAGSAVDRNDVRLYHKCADRSRYDSMRSAAPGCFDVMLWNSDGEATELTRGNLVAELDGRLVTPPIDCGLLAGTFRAELLERREIFEQRLTLSDVQRAERLWFVNSLRGWVAITLAEAGAAAAS